MDSITGAGSSQALRMLLRNNNIRAWCLLRKPICKCQGATAVASPPCLASPWIFYIRMGQAAAESPGALHTFLPSTVTVSIPKGAPDNHSPLVGDKTQDQPLLPQLPAWSIELPLLTASLAVPIPSSHSKDLRYYSKHLQHLWQPCSSQTTVVTATA